MRRALTLAFALLALPLGVSAQEYGKPDELKGLTRVFIDTGTDVKNRERIIKELQKSKIAFELLDSADGAEVILQFGAGTVRRTGNVIVNPQGTVATPVYRKIATGEGVVYVVREGRQRIVMSHEDEQQSGWERKPATNFGREFVKAYKRANGMK